MPGILCVKFRIEHCPDGFSPTQMALNDRCHLIGLNAAVPNIVWQNAYHRSIATLPHAGADGDRVAWHWLGLKYVQHFGSTLLETGALLTDEYGSQVGGGSGCL